MAEALGVVAPAVALAGTVKVIDTISELHDTWKALPKRLKTLADELHGLAGILNSARDCIDEEAGDTGDADDAVSSFRQNTEVAIATLQGRVDEFNDMVDEIKNAGIESHLGPLNLESLEVDPSFPTTSLADFKNWCVRTQSGVVSAKNVRETKSLPTGAWCVQKPVISAACIVKTY